MRAICVGLAISLFTSATSLARQQEDILIFGGKDRDKFLGCLTCGELDSRSVWNELSQHGWKNTFATWNPFGSYRSEFSGTSACNEFASDPPILTDRKGNFYGYLTINENKTDSVCGATGAVQVCRALRVMCADD